jgi:anti-sigma-K factor RskA
MNMENREDLQVLAGEYVLGVLTAEEAAEVDRRMVSETDLRAAIRYWENRLLGMTSLVDPIAPTPDLWSRIENDLSAAVPSRPSHLSTTRLNLWQSLTFWRLISVAGFAVAIVLAFRTFFFEPTSQPPTFAVVLQAQDKTPGWLLQSDARGPLQLTPLGQTLVGPGQALQLWTFIDPAKGPLSLGLVPPDRSVRIPSDRLPPLSPGQLFEISREPRTGSSIGRPTGPVLFIGRAIAVH